MTPHVIDLLPELALGDLPDAEASEVTRHVDGCPTCAVELRLVNETLSALALALEPVEPDTSVRARVLAGCEGGRFARFAESIAAIFDVTATRARELLAMIDDARAWEPGPIDGTGLIHFDAGPACTGADTGFVRVAPGTTFPWHAHNGEETNLVLQGVCVDSDGAAHRRGAVFVHPAGSEHEFTAAAGQPTLIFAVRVFDGVDWDRVRPGSGSAEPAEPER